MNEVMDPGLMFVVVVVVVCEFFCPRINANTISTPRVSWRHRVNVRGSKVLAWAPATGTLRLESVTWMLKQKCRRCCWWGIGGEKPTFVKTGEVGIFGFSGFLEVRIEVVRHPFFAVLPMSKKGTS